LWDDAANPFGETEELIRQYLSVPIAKFSSLYNTLSSNARSYNASFCDHRSWIGKIKKQSKTGIKDKSCGSCVTFGSIAAAELAYYKNFHKTTTFSEQELVDCMYLGGGCFGSILENATLHIFNRGVVPGSKYAYKGTDAHVCNTKPKREHINKFVPFIIDPHNEIQWKSFIFNYGGFSLTMYIDAFTMKDGVVVDCLGASDNQGRINHAVSAVGYGISPKDKIPYILIRNSWGTKEKDHDKGYFKLKIGACNSQAKNYNGFIYDNCDTFSSQSTCTKNPLCTWKSNKCLNLYVSDKTREISSKFEAAKLHDIETDKTNGVGLKDLSYIDVLRRNMKNGSEFLCYLKKANKTSDVTTVKNIYKQAVKAGYVNKKAKIVDYVNFRKMLGIKDPLLLYMVVKDKSSLSNKSDEKYQFFFLPQQTTGYKSFWDARFNQIEHLDDGNNPRFRFFQIYGIFVDGQRLQLNSYKDYE